MAWKYSGFGNRVLIVAALGSVLGVVGCASKQAAESTAPAMAPTESVDATPVTDIAAAEAAADYSLRPDAPLSYVVKRGDTLWAIAKYYLQDPWQWPQLWYGNPQVKNPHLIYPGERLKLVWIGGKPHLVGDRLEPRIQVEPIANAIPTIPIGAIRTFLNGPRLVTESELEKAPYVVEFTSEHIATGANSGIYVKNLPNGDVQNWAVVHPGERYVDPDNGKLLGFEVIPTGTAELRNFAPVSILFLETGTQETVIGDRLLPIEENNFEQNFYPHPPKGKVGATIISVFDGVSAIPQYQVVTLNRGTDTGIDRGTVLSILISDRDVPDPYSDKHVKLPNEYAGTVLVFKTTPKLSYALVMTTVKQAHVGDHLEMPSPSDRY